VSDSSPRYEAARHCIPQDWDVFADWGSCLEACLPVVLDDRLVGTLGVTIDRASDVASVDMTALQPAGFIEYANWSIGLFGGRFCLIVSTIPR